MVGGRYKAVGILEMIWRVAHECGDPILGSDEDVEYSIEWDGEAGACVKALLDAGFIDRLESGDVAIHDLEHHEPEYVKSRRRKENQRRKERESRDPAVTVTGQSRNCHPSPAPAPAPAPNKKRKAGSKKSKSPVFEIPETLRNAAFVEVFNDFIEHRKQIKSPLTQLAGDRLVAKLAKHAPDAALEAINASIENGWKGVFPGDTARNGNKKMTQRQARNQGAISPRAIAYRKQKQAENMAEELRLQAEEKIKEAN